MAQVDCLTCRFNGRAIVTWARGQKCRIEARIYFECEESAIAGGYLDGPHAGVQWLRFCVKSHT